MIVESPKGRSFRGVPARRPGQSDHDVSVETRRTVDTMEGTSISSLDFRQTWVILSLIGLPWLSSCHMKRVMLPPCPECPLAGQSREPQPSSPPQVVYLQNPKPYDFAEILGQTGPQVDLRFEPTVRVVSTHPLTLDVLAVASPAQKVFVEQCGFTIFVPLADARLKSVLSKLKFNQVVEATLFYGGNQEFPHDLVLSELAVDVAPPSNGAAGTCPSQSGLLLSYRGLVEYVNVYTDGTILYQDVLFNHFATQKLSHEELAQLLGTFAGQNFGSIHSNPPLGDLRLSRNSLTLICTRLQNVSLPGLESKLSPLISRLEGLKARATSQTYYLLLVKSRAKLTVHEWPFPRVSLSQLHIGHPAGVGAPADLKEKLPADVLSVIPVGVGAEQSTDNYFTDRGTIYRVNRWSCGIRPACDAFEDLFAHEIRPAEDLVAESHEDPKNPSAGTVLAVVQPIWPPGVEAHLSQVPAQGQRISKEEYEKHLPLYLQLAKAGSYNGLGVDLIEDAYLYHGVRICQVDPLAPATPCMNPNDAKH